METGYGGLVFSFIGFLRRNEPFMRWDCLIEHGCWEKMMKSAAILDDNLNTVQYIDTSQLRWVNDYDQQPVAKMHGRLVQDARN